MIHAARQPRLIRDPLPPGVQFRPPLRFSLPHFYFAAVFRLILSAIFSRSGADAL